MSQLVAKGTNTRRIVKVNVGFEPGGSQDRISRLSLKSDNWESRWTATMRQQIAEPTLHMVCHLEKKPFPADIMLFESSTQVLTRPLN